jgi:hypothetical protein
MSPHDILIASLLGEVIAGCPTVDVANFIDESHLDLEIAAAAMAQSGMQSFSGRSALIGGIPSHFEDMTRSQLKATLDSLRIKYGITMRSFGTRLGKVVLGANGVTVRGNPMTMEAYYEYVRRVAGLSTVMDEPWMRIFTCYPAPGETAEQALEQAAEVTGESLRIIAQEGSAAGEEVEVGLVGHNADMLLAMRKKIGEAFRVIIDVGNLRSVGYSADEIVQQIEALLPISSKELHLKAWLGEPHSKVGEKVDEHALRQFGPIYCDGIHSRLFELLAKQLAVLEKQLGLVPGTFMLVLEPHFLKGGPFGGFTGLPGVGVAHRAALVTLAEAGICVSNRHFLSVRPDLEAVLKG